MDLLTLRAAASGGTIDGIPARSLVAAGFTLLQRSPALVRALAGKRAAILLPTSPQYLVALAAADGRGALLLDPLLADREIAERCAECEVGAVFTLTSLASRLPAGLTTVLLDDAPVTATVLAHDGATTRVDLGSHFGLDVEGEAEATGRDEECVIVHSSGRSGRALGAILTHRNLITNARQVLQAADLSPETHLLALLPYSDLVGLTVAGMAPLLAGGRVTTMARFDPTTAFELLAHAGVTALVGTPDIFRSLLELMDLRGSIALPAATRCICYGVPRDPALQARWADATGVELRLAYGLTEASPLVLFDRADHPNRRGAPGVPLPGVRVSIRDESSGAPCTVGVEGELCVAGETVFRGYVAHGEDGLQVRDGWLHTGDLGVERADGSFELRGSRVPMSTRSTTEAAARG